MNKKHRYKLINKKTGKVIDKFKMKATADYKRKKLKSEIPPLIAKIELIEE